MATKKDRLAEVLRYVEKWRPILFLEQYRIAVELQSEPDRDDERVSAEIRCDLSDQYHHARLDVYPCFWESPVDVREREILHELAHIPMAVVAALVKRQHEGQYVSPLEKQATVERVTDWFTDAIMAAHNGAAREKPAKRGKI